MTDHKASIHLKSNTEKDLAKDKKPNVDGHIDVELEFIPQLPEADDVSVRLNFSAITTLMGASLYQDNSNPQEKPEAKPTSPEDMLNYCIDCVTELFHMMLSVTLMDCDKQLLNWRDRQIQDRTLNAKKIESSHRMCLTLEEFKK